MIGWLKGWIRHVADEGRLVPAAVNSGGPPVMQIFKIDNGYLVHSNPTGAYRENARITYCSTPLDVARQIVNSEVLAKMGIHPAQPDVNQVPKSTI